MDKPTEIINAARELFKTYGYAKTTMTDIANHLEISKALLYYYFTNKESIFVALAGQEQTQFVEEINKLMNDSSEIKSKLMTYPAIRFDLLQKMVTLIINQENYNSVKPILSANAVEFKEKETSLVKAIIQKGIQSGEFTNVDIEEHAVLYINMLRGLINVIFSKFDSKDIPDEKNALFKKQAAHFTNMFINSISK